MNYDWAPQTFLDVTTALAGEGKVVTMTVPALLRLRLLNMSWFNNDDIGHTINFRLQQPGQAAMATLGVSTIAAGGIVYVLPSHSGFLGDLEGGFFEVVGPCNIIILQTTAVNLAGPITQPVEISWLEKTGPGDNGIVPTVAVA